MPRSKDKDINRYIIQIIGQKACLPWLGAAAWDWLIIITTFIGITIWSHPVGYIASLFIIGNRQHGLAILGHDGTHMTIHKNRQINDYLSDIFALWPIGLTTTGYRNLHSRHHQHLNTKDDPELMHRSSKAPQWDLPITLREVLKLAFKDLFGYSISDYWMIVSYSKADYRITYAQMALMHTVFTVSCVATGFYWIPLIWYGSLLTTFMMYFRLRTWLEHQGSDDTHRLKLNWFERLVLAPHNVWHHYEHHSYPSVSFSRLHLVRENLTADPVITVSDLLRNYREISTIKSGTPTKASENLIDEKFVNLVQKEEKNQVSAATLEEHYLEVAE